MKHDGDRVYVDGFQDVQGRAYSFSLDDWAGARTVVHWAFALTVGELGSEDPLPTTTTASGLVTPELRMLTVTLAAA